MRGTHFCVTHAFHFFSIFWINFTHKTPLHYILLLREDEDVNLYRMCIVKIFLFQLQEVFPRRQIWWILDRPLGRFHGILRLPWVTLWYCRASCTIWVRDMCRGFASKTTTFSSSTMKNSRETRELTAKIRRLGRMSGTSWLAMWGRVMRVSTSAKSLQNPRWPAELLSKSSIVLVRLEFLA